MTMSSARRRSAGEPLERRIRRIAALVGLAILTSLALAACGRGESGGGGGGGGGGGEAAKPITRMTILVGTEPGGGFDATARAFAKAAKDAGLANNVQVQNVPGAGNTIALARLANQKGNAGTMQMMGLGLIGGIYANESKATMDDTTPIARLTQESDILVVSEESDYETLDDFVKAWKANPGDLAAGSGSNPGGPDHVALMLAAQAAGIEPKQVNHVSFDGGGELNTALLGNKIAVGSTGVGEVAEQVEAGKLRALAVTAPEAVPGIEAPTLKEAGLDAEFINWRGLVAPPGLSEADTQRLSKFVADVAASKEWKAAVKQNDWTEAFMPTEEYTAYVKSETEQVDRIMTELGLTS
jgi:putative tricarboxylic transport membrane protein